MPKNFKKSHGSKFKNASLNKTGYEHWYHDIRVIEENPQYGSFIAASSQLVAYASDDNTVSVSPLKFFEKYENLDLNPEKASGNFKKRSATQEFSHVSSTPLRGVHFSYKEIFEEPIYTDLNTKTSMISYKQAKSFSFLGSFSKDSAQVHKLSTKLNNKGKSFDFQSSLLFEVKLEDCRGFKFNKACHDIVLVMDEKKAKIYDINNSDEIFCGQPFASPVSSFDWMKDGTGKGVVCALEDRSLSLCDTRANKFQCVKQMAHESSGKIELEASGKYVFTIGYEKGRKKALKVWDDRNFDKPVCSTMLTNNPGRCFFNIDASIDVLHLVNKSETVVNMFDISYHEKPYIAPITKASVTRKQIISSCLVPKAALDIYGNELNRLLLLNKDSIESVRIEVQRRRKNFFYEELYPDTVNPLQSLSTEKWKISENVEISRNNVLDLYKIKNGIAAREQAVENQAKLLAEQKKNIAEHKLESKQKEAMTKTQQVYKKNTKMIGFIPKYKNLAAKTPKLEVTYYDFKNLSEGIFAASSTHFAAAMQYSNDIYIRNLRNIGKAEHPPLEKNLLKGHTAKINCLEFHPLDDDILVSGSVDGSIIVWQAQKIVFKEIMHSNSVTMFAFHPCVKTLIASSSTHHDLKFFDYTSGKQSLLVENVVVDKIRTDKINHLSYDYFGKVLYILTGSNKLVKFSLRENKGKIELSLVTAIESGLSTSKTGIVKPIGSKGMLLVSGFAAKTGMRVIKVFSSFGKNLKCSATLKSSAGSGISVPHIVHESLSFFVTSKGEASVKVYELKLDSLKKQQVEIHKCVDLSSATKGAPFVTICQPFRVNNVDNFEVGNLVQFYGSKVEILKLYMPRSGQVKDVFADDLYPSNKTLSGKPTFNNTKDFLKALQKNEKIVPNVLKTLNVKKKQLYSERIQEIKKVRTSNVLKTRTKIVQEAERKKKLEEAAFVERKTRLARITDQNHDLELKRRDENLGLDSEDEWSDE